MSSIVEAKFHLLVVRSFSNEHIRIGLILLFDQNIHILEILSDLLKKKASIKKNQITDIKLERRRKKREEVHTELQYHRKTTLHSGHSNRIQKIR